MAGTAWRRVRRTLLLSAALLAPLLAAGATALVVAVGDGQTVTTSPTGAAWTLRPVTTSLPLYGVASDGTNWVAVGAYGTILSGNGASWTQYTPNPTTSALRAVATDGNGNWVAVGDDGVILQSSNPAGPWTAQSIPTFFNNLNSVATTGSAWVIVGDRISGDAAILSSTGPPGWTWVVQSSGTTNNLKGVARDGTNFVAVGAAGTVLTSPSTGPSAGVGWTPQCPNPPGTGTGCPMVDLRAVAGDGTQWTAVGSAGAVFTSPNANAWTQQCPNPPGGGSGCGASSLRGVAYGGGQWVSVGDSGRIATSPGASAWTGRTSGTSNHVTGIAYGGGLWVALADYGLVLTSSDGVTWSVNRPNTSTWPYGLRDVASDGVRFVAVGRGPVVNDGAYPVILTSTDATTWVSQVTGPSMNRDLRSVAGGGNTWITNSPHDTDQLASGDGGIHWAGPTAGGCTPTCIFAVETNGTAWIMAGGGGGQATHFRRSTNGGATWTSHNGPNSPWGVRLYGIATDGNRWVAVGEAGGSPPSGTILSSTDGMSWTQQTSNTGANLNGIARAGSTWVAVGDGGVILSGNADATSWTVRVSPGAGPDLNAVAASTSGSLWVAVGDGGTVRTSTTGLAWNPPITGGTTNDLYGVTIEPGPPSCTASPTAALIGASVTFTGSGGTPSYTWSSPGSSDPTTGAGPTHQRSYGTSGVKTVTITDRFGQSANCAVTIVDPLTCADQAGVVGNAITVTASGGMAPHTWTTTGSSNDGPVSSASWSGSFAAPGMYTLTLTNSAPSQSTSCQLRIVERLTCSASPSALVSGNSATLTPAGPAGPYAWTATGGTPATASGTPTIQYPSVGAQTATVTTGDPDQSASCTVNVVAPLACSPSPLYAVAGALVGMNAVGGTSPFAWSLPGSTPATATGTSATARYDTPGSYTAYLNNTGPPAQASTCSVTVAPVLACAADDALLLRGETATINATGGTPPYAWSVAGGIPGSGTGASWSTRFDVAGTYAVSLQDAGLGGAAQSRTCTIQVDDPPLTCTLTNPYVPQGGTARLVADGGSGFYAWAAASGSPTTGTTRWFNTTYVNQGAFVVQVTSGGQVQSCGVMVQPPPPPPGLPYPAGAFSPAERGVTAPRAHVEPDRAPCGDWLVMLDGTGSSDSDGTVRSWAWAFGDGRVGSGPVMAHEYPGPGTYPLVLTVRDDSGLVDKYGLDVVLRDCLPVTVAAPEATAREGEPVVACVQARGGLGTYTFAAGPLPAGATFDPVTGCLAWTPAEGQAGIDCLPVTASDGLGTGTTCLKVRVSRTAIPLPPPPTLPPSTGTGTTPSLPGQTVNAVNAAGNSDGTAGTAGGAKSVEDGGGTATATASNTWQWLLLGVALLGIGAFAVGILIGVRRRGRPA